MGTTTTMANPKPKSSLLRGELKHRITIFSLESRQFDMYMKNAGKEGIDLPQSTGSKPSGIFIRKKDSGNGKLSCASTEQNFRDGWSNE